MNTEEISPRYLDLDLWETQDVLTALYESQLAAAAALGPALPAIGAAVEASVSRLRRGGRLIYVGAGSSARIGVQDGAELHPTFSWPKDRVEYVIAGGPGALLEAIENAEDLEEEAAARINEIAARPMDVAIGLAASGETPFTVSAMKSARARGALAIGLSGNASSRLLQACDHPILLNAGAEPIAGSTRLKAGTAQKIALNLISTAAMVRLGRVYRGLMVDMRPTNEKLRQRAIRMVANIAGCTAERAADALKASDGEVKLASLVAKGLPVAQARDLLDRHDGRLRSALRDASG